LIDAIHLCAEILGEHGTRADGKKFEDDGRASEDLVPEPEDKVEVLTVGLLYVHGHFEIMNNANTLLIWAWSVSKIKIHIGLT
jgi:hypothetical protein